MNVPAGWKLVPVEATDEMVNCDPSPVHRILARPMWRAMLAAAPSAPAPAERQSEVAEQLQRRLDEAVRGDPFTTSGERTKWLTNVAADAIAALRGGRTTDSDAASVGGGPGRQNLASDQGGSTAAWIQDALKNLEQFGSHVIWRGSNLHGFLKSSEPATNVKTLSDAGKASEVSNAAPKAVDAPQAREKE